MSDRFVHLGSYTPDSSAPGRGAGVTAYRQDPGSGALTPVGDVTPVSGPSFLAWHPTGRFLYAVTERQDGSVNGYAVDGAALRPLGSRPTGGSDPCHLSVDPTGRYLVTANYGSGSVSVHPIATDGSLGERVDLVQRKGSGPVTDRQEGPHAHQARFDPAGRYVLVNDLGTDTVTAYRLEGGKLVESARTALPAGTGPRHLAFGAGDRVYLAGELDSSVTALEYDAGSGALTAVGSVRSTGYDGVSFPSEIAASADGRYVYVANRGPNTVCVLAAEPAGVRLVAEVGTGGDWPRHLLLLGDFLYVANQNSDTVGIFRVDGDTGVPEPAGSLAVPSPACLIASLS
ncbi:lactonase family protein [Actinocatenispora rupis]|uniref:6-phosphogluconolactonase, cycloisomerase 2 family n=1 Tax=Actinocatenispora rupis TaxID=519421 RepID=A0A8J3IY21_9ACTN|nr:lactonase family protein [Actinocatenispora rupis]GID10763.1 hypothetical protein Aru02nite_16520 [Actinocatenispora rupis]